MPPPSSITRPPLHRAREALALLASLLLLTRASCKLVPFTAHGQDSLGVLSVDIEPYPAYPGENVTIRVAAVPGVALLPGSKTKMVVKQAGIPIPTRTYDLCQCSSNGREGLWANTPTVLRFQYPVPGFAFKGTASARVTTTNHLGEVISFLSLTIEVGPKRSMRARQQQQQQEAVPASASWNRPPQLLPAKFSERLASSSSFLKDWQPPPIAGPWKRG